MTRKPAEPFDAEGFHTTIRVSQSTAMYFDDVMETLAEWMLGSADPDTRRAAMAFSKDHALRIILATFARDYGLSLYQKDVSP